MPELYAVAQRQTTRKAQDVYRILSAIQLIFWMLLLCGMNKLGIINVQQRIIATLMQNIHSTLGYLLHGCSGQAED